MDLQGIQDYLREHNIDGWLLADFHSRNEIAVATLSLSSSLTRRAFYFIPVNGTPTALVNPIELDKFLHLDGEIIPCLGYRLLEEKLAALLSGVEKIAMEYSPMGRLPYIGLVDAGTIELIRSFGPEIVSSADLVSNFQARLSTEQIESHRRAASKLIEIKDASFGYIKDSLTRGDLIKEFDVCCFIRNKFEEAGMKTSFGPNCSVGPNAGNPHYEPTAELSDLIKRGQLILIDLWARETADMCVYADITWMAFAGTKEEIPEKYMEIFKVLASARDNAVKFLTYNFKSKELFGFDVDDACREVIIAAGFDEYFTHRTGHSITDSVHGVGPNIDNLESEDRRKLLPGHLFSIEPGIYMKDCGFRTEIDCLITEDGPKVTTLPLQREILPLF